MHAVWAGIVNWCPQATFIQTTRASHLDQRTATDESTAILYIIIMNCVSVAQFKEKDAVLLSIKLLVMQTEQFLQNFIMK